MSSKKGVGSTINGRDSNPKYLGLKKSGGQMVTAGNTSGITSKPSTNSAKIRNIRHVSFIVKSSTIYCRSSMVGTPFLEKELRLQKNN